MTPLPQDVELQGLAPKLAILSSAATAAGAVAVRAAVRGPPVPELRAGAFLAAEGREVRAFLGGAQEEAEAWWRRCGSVQVQFREFSFWKKTRKRPIPENSSILFHLILSSVNFSVTTGLPGSRRPQLLGGLGVPHRATGVATARARAARAAGVATGGDCGGEGTDCGGGWRRGVLDAMFLSNSRLGSDLFDAFLFSSLNIQGEQVFFLFLHML